MKQHFKNKINNLHKKAPYLDIRRLITEATSLEILNKNNNIYLLEGRQ